MSDLLFRADPRNATVTVFERAKGIELNTLAVLTEKECQRLYAWMGATIFDGKFGATLIRDGENKR